MKLKDPKQIIYATIVIYLILFFWLFNRHFAPFGTWPALTQIAGPTPDYRISGQKIIETPVYFKVHNPRKFDSAEMQVRFRGEAPIIEAGVVKNQDPWAVERHVLYHKYLEELQWPRLEEDGLVLWQRTAQYKTVKEFLNNPPAVEKVAVVDAPLVKGAGEPEGMKALPQQYNVSLRGPQDIYLYTVGEDIKLEFLFHDLNRHDGADPISTRLYNNLGEMIVEEKLDDDGIVWGTGQGKTPRKLMVRYSKPTPGIYRLVIVASDDVFIRQINTNQGKMVWKGQLYLGDEIGYSANPRPSRITVWSNGQGFALRTPHPESVQTTEFVYSNWKTTLQLSEYNKQYTIQMPRAVAGSLVSMTIPKRDIILNSDGFFALSASAFFLLEPISYSSDLDLDRLGINFVLARYTKADEKNGWYMNKVSLATFDVDPTRPLQFFIGTPHGQVGEVEIDKIGFILKKPHLTVRRIIDKIGGYGNN